MVPGIVLAAGRSSRFGSSKALAPAGRMSFASRIVATLQRAGVPTCIVVIRLTDRALMDELSLAAPFVRIVVNEDPDRGQLSSLVAGLDAVDAPGVEGVLVTLVDMPLVTAETIRRVIDRAAVSAAAVVRAVHGGRHGHPVVFKRATFEALRQADPAVGAKAVVQAFEVDDVEVPDAGAVEDVDTPEDYKRLFGGG